MALFISHDVIVNGQGCVWVPGTIWGGTRTCFTGDKTSLGHQPITTETTPATPSWPVLLTSEIDQDRRKKTDRHHNGGKLHGGGYTCMPAFTDSPYHSQNWVSCQHPYRNVCFCLLTYSKKKTKTKVPLPLLSLLLNCAELLWREAERAKWWGLWNGVMTDCCALLGCTACTCSKLRPFQIYLVEK